MSTGAGCRFTEVEPGRWTYWLQDYPYGETELGATYGPFGSFDRAEAHLRNTHPNPGGWSTIVHPTDHRHEWAEGDAQVQVGFTIELNVESLGPDAGADEVILLAKGLPVDHPAWRVRPRYAWREGVTTCRACGELRGLDQWPTRAG